MPSIVRNVLAVLIGLVIGGMVNGALIAMSASIVPPPPGVDPNNAESLRKGIHLFEARHFVMPFLAHALGTLAGALLAYFIAASYKIRFAYAIGIVFLCGGIAACFMIPAPAWFMAVDLIFAYLPMAWLAIWLGSRIGKSKES
jgi:hypothetical protein